MFPKPSSLLFSLTLASGTFMSISASTWMGAWMGLEINMMSFIPLISDSKDQRSTESALKYFIVQVIGSVVIITMALVMVSSSSIFFSWVLSSPLILALLLKAGAAPVHFWFPGVMEGMGWVNSMTLMTWQKIAPLMLISYVNMPLIITMSAMTSGMVGALGGLNQSLLRKLMAYSSIGHMGWMLASMNCSETIWTTYMVIYSLLSITVASMFYKTNSFHISQLFQTLNGKTTQKYTLSINLLSLGGLPPFLGFFPKWMAMQAIMSSSPFTIMVLILGALINLFYYLRLTFASFTTTLFTQKMELKYPLKINLVPESFMATLSILGMLTLPLVWPL